MPNLGRAFRKFFGVLERWIGNGQRGFRRALGLKPPMQIVHYMGHANNHTAYLMGRVQKKKYLSPPGEEDTKWLNFFMMMRRYCTDERPGAKVRASLAGQEQILTTDEEGYFEANFELSQPLDASVRLHDIQLELLKPLGRHQHEVRATGKVQLPPVSPQFGIISDIDDTVIHTGATNFMRMVRVVMLGNARTRLAFKGVAAFYKALRAGASGKSQNPIFYVTSSPWNIYDVVCEVFHTHGIPLGPLFMKDYGFDETKFIKSSHGSHKLASIRKILELYPDFPFILIGDSGQKDPEIYREIVHDFPSRIKAIYIRDVTESPERDAAVQALGSEVEKTGTSLILSKDTIAAARHAAETGLINPDALTAIDQDRKHDEAEPTIAEKLLNQQT